MQIVFSVIGVVLSVNSVVSVSSHIYDDNAYPKANPVSFMKYGSVIKKRFTGNDLLSKFDSRKIDHIPYIRYHDIKKNSAFAFGPTHNWNTAPRQYPKVNQPLTTPEMTPQRKLPQQERPRYDTNVKSAATQNQRKVKDRTVSIKEASNRAAYGDNHQNRYMEHQARSAFFKRLGPRKDRYEMFKVMDVNVNKVPLKVDYQNKFNKANGRYNNMPPISMNRVPNHYRRMPPALKSMQKSEKYSDRNSPLMYKMLDDMSRRIPDTIIKKYDSKKREIKGIPRDNIVKYVHNKRGRDYLKTLEVAKHLDNSDETDTKTNDMPYAVFYRMNPVSMDYHTDIVMDKLDDAVGTYKGKTVPADSKILMTKHEPVQEGNIRLQNKIKGFVTFKKY